MQKNKSHLKYKKPKFYASPPRAGRRPDRRTGGVEFSSPAEYKAGLDLAIARGWLVLHESGTYVKFTQTGAELFA